MGVRSPARPLEGLQTSPACYGQGGGGRDQLVPLDAVSGWVATVGLGSLDPYESKPPIKKGGWFMPFLRCSPLKISLFLPVWAAQARKSDFECEDGRFRSCKPEPLDSRPKPGLDTWGSDRPPAHWKASKLRLHAMGKVGGGRDQLVPLDAVSGWVATVGLGSLDPYESKPPIKKGDGSCRFCAVAP